MKNNVEMILCLFHDMTLECLVIASSIGKRLPPPVQVADLEMMRSGRRLGPGHWVSLRIVDVLRQFALDC